MHSNGAAVTVTMAVVVAVSMAITVTMAVAMVIIARQVHIVLGTGRTDRIRDIHKAAV